jgi:hypothetical protein
LVGGNRPRQVFLAGKPSSTFWLLAISCSFRAVEKEPMETAWLQVSLSTVNPDGAAAPVAWPMEPTMLDDAVQVTRTTKLDASLKLASDHVPIDIGPSSGREITRAYTERRPFLEALHEGTERPAWVFTRTPVTEIRGLHRLRTVVELAARSVGQADISAGAILKAEPARAVSVPGEPGRSSRQPHSADWPWCMISQLTQTSELRSKQVRPACGEFG